MAIDVGTRRIGIAVSDPLGMIAKPHSTIARNRDAFRKIKQIADEMEITEIIIGLPLHLNGSESKQSADVRNFSARLSEVCPVPSRFKDERLTSVEAEERLADRRGDWKKHKGLIDQFAAAEILQDYLNQR